ncbi:MAG: M14 family zinc carboxypeptidase [Vicinamibacterales bacterium]
MRSRTSAFIPLVIVLLLPALAAAQTQTPEQFFGFKPGTDGELARYPKVVEYFQHLARTTDRVRFEVVGKTTMNNDYVLAAISAPENLAKLDRLTQITRRLADPRGLSEQEAQALIQEGRPFYFLYTTIHSTEVGNMQAVTLVAHALATDSSPATREVIDNSVVLIVPSQNPDGQVMVIDHWYKTKGTALNRVFPDLYHKYVGHDNNRDWFMFTQKETQLAIQIQSRFKPQITHDMHQMGATRSRIFVPPFQDPYDPNIHPILAMGQATVGQAMATALIAEGKEGVAWNESYDLWTPARQYMVYHGQPRILTEIASANLADPFVNPAGRDRPLGPQESRMNFPRPYSKGTWTLGQIVDYGVTAALAGITHVAKYRQLWLENFYKVQRDAVNWTGAPYAFIVPAGQRDPMATRELLEILHTGEVELHRALAPFTAGGNEYAAGSVVVKVAQPFGPFAKTMLETQVYPDLRLFPGGPPKPPYDVTAHTLGLLMGVEVDQIAQPFEAGLELMKTVDVPASPLPARPKYAYLVGPESNAGFKALAELQKANVPVYRSAEGFESGGRQFAAGTWIVSPVPSAAKILATVAKETGLPVSAADRAPGVDGFRVKAGTRIGLYRGANNMPGGWLMWLFEQYGFNHQIVTAHDFDADLSSKYDVIVMPSGLTKERIVTGLDPARHAREWAWAYGVGDAGWKRLADFVKNGGTIVAIGSATETARELLDLPIEKVLPEGGRRRPPGQGPGGPAVQVAASEVERQLKDAFTSPARLMQTLRDRVADPASLFYCPGSLLQNEFDPSHPVGFGMPAAWPVFFESDQAYRLRPGFGIDAQVVSRYPRAHVLQSGWLLGEEYLHDQANVVAFTVGRGTAVTLASQIDYRTQPRGTLKLLFNAMFHGPSTPMSAAQMQRLESTGTH